MGKIYRCLCVTVLILFSCIAAHAQRRQVSGIVKSETGSPMPGVTVLLKGTTMGVSTDTEGKFSIQAMPEDVLKISFIGYLSEQIPVGNKTSFDITIQPDIATLSEVVVIGYGESKRKDVTGSISSVTGAEIRKTNPVTFDQALQGKVAGMVVQQTSGQPGGGPMRVLGAPRWQCAHRSRRDRWPRAALPQTAQPLIRRRSGFRTAWAPLQSVYAARCSTPNPRGLSHDRSPADHVSAPQGREGIRSRLS